MILAKVLVKRLALIIEKLVDMAQRCAEPGRNIHDNLNLMSYIIYSVVKEPDMGGR